MKEFDDIWKIIKNERPYASFWEWPDKNVKEAGIMRDFLEARSKLGLPDYASVTAFSPDPPDFVAYDKTGSATAIELTELVSEEIIRENLKIKDWRKQYYRDWGPEEVFTAIEERLNEKDSKEYHGGPYSEIHIVIHTDEPIISPQEYIPQLQSRTFPLQRQISRAFVLFSYDPRINGYPLVELQFSKEDMTS